MNRTNEICEALIRCHRQRGWRAEKEALFTPRRIDVLAIAPGGSEVVAYEIKVSRVDFFNELKDPAKRETVIRHCTQFYFVTPLNLVSEAEIPPGCGLIYFEIGYDFLEIVKDAPGRSETELPFETINREFWEKEEREEDLEVFNILLDREFDEGVFIESIAETQFPAWMKTEIRRKPLHFQFDVAAIAATMPSVAIIPLEIQFDEVPA